MDSAYCMKLIELLTKWLHHRNISMVLITQTVINQYPSSRDIPLKSNSIVVFKDRRDKTQIVHFAWHVYPLNISGSQNTYLEACKDPHNYFFLDLSNRLTMY